MRAILALMALPLSAHAEPRLTSPLDCPEGVACYVQSYVDRDPGPGALDAACGPQSYDGHKGTDFALPSLAAMEAGAEVVASAPGTVRAVRDGMADALWDGADLGGRDCGNGVVVEHGEGWETQYCHLALGSVAVAAGEAVERGDGLGLVGLSGRTQFPHVHLSVRRGGEVVDPLDLDGGACGEGGAQLFDPPLAVTGGGLVSAGILPRAPEFEEVKAGVGPEVLTRGAPLVGWALVHGARPGDLVRLRALGPDGAGFEQEAELERVQALAFRYMGRRAPEGGWPAGRYAVEAEHVREGRVLGRRAFEAVVE